MVTVDITGRPASIPRPASTARPTSTGRRRILPRATGIGRGARALTGVVLLAALWELAPRSGLVDRVMLAPLSEVLTRWWELAQSGDIWDHTRASLVRALTGFGLAVLVALPLGLAIGWFRPVAQILNPVLEIFRNTAVLALLPVFIIIFGIGETSKIAIVLYACVWPILLNTISGVQSVDPLLVKSARSMGLGPIPLFRKVILPAAVPTIFTGIRMAGSASILVLIAAELVGAREGLGSLINNAQANFAIPDMYAGIVTVAGVGLVFNQVLVLIERRLSRWRAPLPS